jgi:hypothetical protein
MTGVHHHGEGSAPSWHVWCHRPFSTESVVDGVGHRLGTAMPRAVHRPNFPKAGFFSGLAWVVTTTATLSGAPTACWRGTTTHVR